MFLSIFMAAPHLISSKPVDSKKQKDAQKSLKHLQMPSMVDSKELNKYNDQKA